MCVWNGSDRLNMSRQVTAARLHAGQYGLRRRDIWRDWRTPETPNSRFYQRQKVNMILRNVKPQTRSQIRMCAPGIMTPEEARYRNAIWHTRITKWFATTNHDDRETFPFLETGTDHLILRTIWNSISPTGSYHTTTRSEIRWWGPISFSTDLEYREDIHMIHPQHEMKRIVGNAPRCSQILMWRQCMSPLSPNSIGSSYKQKGTVCCRPIPP